jgi:hypothetical protein
MSINVRSLLIIGREGLGESGWHIYASHALRCVLVGRERLAAYEKDFTWDGIATRKLSAAWLTWLRRHHGATTEEAAEFARIVKLINPELCGVTEEIPHRYLPPFAMPNFFSFPGGCS